MGPPTPLGVPWEGDGWQDRPRANAALCPLCPQLLSCVFVQQMQSNFCWAIQLFSLVCTVKGYYDRELPPWAVGALGVPYVSWWRWFGLLPDLPASLPASQGDGRGPRLLAARGGGGHHLGQHLLLLPPAPAPHLPQLLLLARQAGLPGFCLSGFQVGLGSWRGLTGVWGWGWRRHPPAVPAGAWRCSRPVS